MAPIAPLPKKKKEKPLTSGERTLRLPDRLTRIIQSECIGRGATTKTSLVTELLWEAINKRKKAGEWQTP